MMNKGVRPSLLSANARQPIGFSRWSLSFHPERLSVKSQSVAEGLLQDGIYRSQFETGLSSPFRDPSARQLGRSLDSFIEAQVHGTINLYEDVERLVADPCFRGGPIQEVFMAIGAKYDIPLNWHPGFTLPVAKVPDYFRGFAVKP